MAEPIIRTGPDEREILSDADIDGPPCPVCGLPEERVECWDCGGLGETEDGELYEQDPLWYDPDDVEPCVECQSKGFWYACPMAGQPGHGENNGNNNALHHPQSRGDND